MSRGSGGDPRGDADPTAIARQLRQRADREKRRQLAMATAKLDECHHEALEALCDRITAQVLASPMVALELAAEADRPDLARMVATLFDVEDSDVAGGSAADAESDPPVAIER